MINKRLNFIKSIGMDKDDSFDISKISDKLKRKIEIIDRFTILLQL